MGGSTEWTDFLDLVYNRRVEVNIHEAKTHFSRLLQRVAAVRK